MSQCDFFPECKSPLLFYRLCLPPLLTFNCLCCRLSPCLSFIAHFQLPQLQALSVYLHCSPSVPWMLQTLSLFASTEHIQLPLLHTLSMFILHCSLSATSVAGSLCLPPLLTFISLDVADSLPVCLHWTHSVASVADSLHVCPSLLTFSYLCCRLSLFTSTAHLQLPLLQTLCLPPLDTFSWLYCRLSPCLALFLTFSCLCCRLYIL